MSHNLVVSCHITQDSSAYASSVIRNILAKVRILAEFPFIGRIVPEFDDDSIREIFAYNYRIIYRVSESEINVAAVIHGRQLDISLEP